MAMMQIVITIIMGAKDAKHIDANSINAELINDAIKVPFLFYPTSLH
jgi:hypothetical protein